MNIIKFNDLPKVVHGNETKIKFGDYQMQLYDNTFLTGKDNYAVIYPVYSTSGFKEKVEYDLSYENAIKRLHKKYNLFLIQYLNAIGIDCTEKL